MHVANNSTALKTTHFFLEKLSCLEWDSNPRHSACVFVHGYFVCVFLWFSCMVVSMAMKCILGEGEPLCVRHLHDVVEHVYLMF